MEKNIFDTLKGDAKNATYKIVANKSSFLLKESIVKIIEKKSNSDIARSFAKFLDTDVGLSFINVLMGTIIDNVPQLQNNNNAIRLGEEFRVNGMTVAGNALLEQLIDKSLVGLLELSSQQKARVLPNNLDVEVRDQEDDKVVVNERKVL